MTAAWYRFRQATGAIDDPEITPLHPSAVGEGLVNMFTNLLNPLPDCWKRFPDMSVNPIFSQEQFLPYSVMGASNHVRMDRLLSLFQDAAGIHAHQMGVSGFDLAKKQLKWVISRYQIRVIHPLTWPGPYDLRTWRFPWKNLYEIREFEIVSSEGALCIRALSVWVMVKAENTRPVRLAPHMPPALMERSGPPPDLWPNPSGPV